MNPCPSRDELQACLRGDASQEIADHVASCPHCQAEMEKLPDEPDAFADEVRQAAVQEPPFPEKLAAITAVGPLPPVRPLPYTLGDFELLEEIGHGGMGVVYRAVQHPFGRRVAVKLLPPGAGGELLTRFRREIRASGRLDHPNLVRAVAAGEINGEPFLVLEWIEGENLRELVGRVGPLSVANACAILQQVAVALQRAHELGLVHRDLTPRNIMLTRLGQVKVVDFGLGRSRDLDELTVTPDFMGVYDYASPEQFQDPRTVDIRGDLYSVGCLAHFLLTGRPAFHDAPGGVAKKQAHLNREAPTVPNVPAPLAALVGRLLAKKPEERPQTPAEVAAELARFLPRQESPPDLRALLESVSGAEQHPSLDAALDVWLWDETAGRAVSITEPGALPLPPRARLMLEVRLSRPAHVYLLWIGSDGAVQPVYPWKPNDWKARAEAGPVRGLRLPPRDGKGKQSTWRVQGLAGVETFVLLADEHALSDETAADLPSRLRGFPRLTELSPPRDPACDYWFTSRLEECLGVGLKALDFTEEPIKDPIYQVHSLLRERLGDRFGLIRAVSFFKRGEEGGDA